MKESRQCSNSVFIYIFYCFERNVVLMLNTFEVEQMVKRLPGFLSQNLNTNESLSDS